MNRPEHQTKATRYEIPGSCSSAFLIAVAPTAILAVLLCGVRQFLTDIPVFAATQSATARSVASSGPDPRGAAMARKAEAGRCRYERVILAPRLKQLVAKQAQAPLSDGTPAARPGSIVVTRGQKPLRQTALDYPADAKIKQVSGLVEMQLIIAEDGSVHDVTVLRGDPLLCVGLADEIQKWTYQPLRINGEPIAMSTELALTFSLDSNVSGE